MTAPSPRTATPARSSLWTVSERLSSLALPATDFFQHAGKTVHAVRCLRFRQRCCQHMQRAHTAGRNPEQYLLLADRDQYRSEEHTSELQSLMRISYAVFCLKKKTHK